MTSTPPPLSGAAWENLTGEAKWELMCNGSQNASFAFLRHGALLNMSAAQVQDAGPFCTHVFDEWACWPDTPAGFTALVPCPHFITGFDPTRYAHKECDENGSWFRHWSTNRPWSNYTNCVDIDSLMWEEKVILIYKAGYLVSLVALLVSLGMFLYFKSLRCTRTTLHMNLFSSFALNNFIWLLWYALVVERPEVIQENGAGCQLLDVVLHYFLVSNYCWMLCEGFYLHTLLVATFVSEARLLRWLFALGWGTPALAVPLYAAMRASDPDVAESGECWINQNSKYRIVLNVPVCAAIGLNVIFMVNIVRVVVRKLLAGPRVGAAAAQRPSSTLLQALRATLLLVPLLGLQYMLTPFKPDEKHEYFRIYEVTLAITASFQGLCVATLFCFCNGEVIAQVKRRWQHLMFRPRANSCTATTVSFVRSTNGPLTGEDNV